MMKPTTAQDPLYVIFERHLYRSSTEGVSTKAFIDAVVQDYLVYLSNMGVHIPGKVRPALVEDITEEVREMTLKKTYGSVSVSEFQEQAGKDQSRPVPRKIA
jgi:hypothetical protein